MPDEARQPSMFIEMVPIHTKLLALADERKVFPSCLSAHMQKGIFIFTEKSPVLKPWNNLALVSGNYSYGDWQDDISL